jgi:hypothetical protein
MVIKAVSLSEVSEIAMVPESECKIPTLMVSPLLTAAVGSDVAVSAFSAGFEQPVKAIVPIIAVARNVFVSNFCWNILIFSKLET